MQGAEALEADLRDALVERLGQPLLGADVVAAGQQVARVEADADALVAARGVDELGELGERAAERAARARRVLEVDRAALGLLQRLREHLPGALDRGPDLAGLRAAGVQDDGLGLSASPACSAAVRAVSDLSRISLSSEAQLRR